MGCTQLPITNLPCNNGLGKDNQDSAHQTQKTGKQLSLVASQIAINPETKCSALSFWQKFITAPLQGQISTMWVVSALIKSF